MKSIKGSKEGIARQVLSAQPLDRVNQRMDIHIFIFVLHTNSECAYQIPT